MFAFLAAHRGELFADEDFADLFPSGKGRPSVPASVMASVMVLQVLHDHSDAEAARCERHTRKSPENRRDGYRAHVVPDPETGIITGEKLTKAAGEENSDAAVAAQFVAGQAAGGGPVCEWYGDTSYGTGDLRAAIGQAGHCAVIKPGPLKAAVEGGFTRDDFTVDEAAGIMTCPAGVIRRISARRYVTFGTACTICPLRARCTTTRRGRRLE